MKIDLDTVQQGLLDDLVKSVSNTENLSKERTVYLMVLFRKVLEISNLEKDANFLTLTFFIDWTFHARKTRNSHWFNDIKQKVESSIENSKKTLQAKGINRVIDPKYFWEKEFHNHISLHSLRNDLELFASTFQIDINILFISKNWDYFRDSIMHVLADAPIEIDDTDCPVSSILIHSDKNKMKFSQGEGMAKHVCDYVLIYRDGSFATVSFMDGTMPISAQDASDSSSKI